MDWGLLRSREPGKWGLRPKIKYPNYFYYTALVINAMLRFVWLLTLSWPNEWFAGWFGKFHGLYFLLAFLEAYRRAQWAIFRVENENVNNFE